MKKGKNAVIRSCKLTWPKSNSIPNQPHKPITVITTLSDELITSDQQRCRRVSALLRFPGGSWDSRGWNFNASTTSCGDCGETFGPSSTSKLALFSLPAALRIIIKMIRFSSLISTPAVFACVCWQTSVDAEPLKLHGRVTPANDKERMVHRKQPSTSHLLHRGYAGTALPNAHFLFLFLALFKAFHCLEVFKKNKPSWDVASIRVFVFV